MRTVVMVHGTSREIRKTGECIFPGKKYFTFNFKEGIFDDHLYAKESYERHFHSFEKDVEQWKFFIDVLNSLKSRSFVVLTGSPIILDLKYNVDPILYLISVNEILSKLDLDVKAQHVLSSSDSYVQEKRKQFSELNIMSYQDIVAPMTLF